VQVSVASARGQFETRPARFGNRRFCLFHDRLIRWILPKLQPFNIRPFRRFRQSGQVRRTHVERKMRGR
jgi:hypothetical protein